jgi:hypothetical protein
MKTTGSPGRKIKCDCCGTETMAEIRDDKIIIMDKRHGRRHIAVLKITDLLAIMQQSPVKPV